MPDQTSNIKLLTSPRPLRIGFDAKRAFNNGTGLGNYSRFVINGLMTLYPQHEYFLFTPGIKPEYESFYTAGQNIHLITPESFFGKQFSFLWRSYAIADMCSQLNLDVFHGLSNELPVGIEGFKGKKIVTIHDLIFLRYPAYYNNIDRYIYTKKFKRACYHADLILAASKQTQSDIEHYLGTSTTKIQIGYQNCDERFAGIKTAEEKNLVRTLYALPDQFILSVGTIEQRKNQLTVLKAFHRLNHPDLSLVFIGKQTEYADQLKEYIAEAGLSSKVQFLQRIPAEYLPAIYQSARIFVYASEFEGFGIPVLEGMRSGIPVIAAKTSSLPEVGGTAIAYFNPADIAALATCFNETLSKSFDTGGYGQQLALFDTPKLIAQLEAHYQV
jgi:glycosyltransferase involved in cell wall biosynthesis